VVTGRRREKRGRPEKERLVVREQLGASMKLRASSPERKPWPASGSTARLSADNRGGVGDGLEWNESERKRKCDDRRVEGMLGEGPMLFIGTQKAGKGGTAPASSCR
jgi:hypothetical protein